LIACTSSTTAVVVDRICLYAVVQEESAILQLRLLSKQPALVPRLSYLSRQLCCVRRQPSLAVLVPVFWVSIPAQPDRVELVGGSVGGDAKMLQRP